MCRLHDCSLGRRRKGTKERFENLEITRLGSGCHEKPPSLVHRDVAPKATQMVIPASYAQLKTNFSFGLRAGLISPLERTKPVPVSGLFILESMSLCNCVPWSAQPNKARMGPRETRLFPLQPGHHLMIFSPATHHSSQFFPCTSGPRTIRSLPYLALMPI